MKQRRVLFQRILVILLALIVVMTGIIPFIPGSFSGQSLILPVAQAAEDTTADGSNGDWSASKVTYYASDPNHANIGAEVMVRYGDIDNFGADWGGKNPFTGEVINAPYPTIIHESDDPDGTDQLMVVKGFIDAVKNNKISGDWKNRDDIADGYTRSYYYTKSQTLPSVVPIDMVYNLRGIQVKSAVLQMYVNDFQARKPKDKGWNNNVTYTAYLNGVAAPFISNQINTMNQRGPLGQLLTFNIPTNYLPLLQDGRLTIKLDDDTTTENPYGDAMAIDFVKLLINPGDYSNVGSISGKVTDTANKPIAGATVSVMGMAVAVTDSSGNYQLNKVPFGLVVLEASASGYQTERMEIPNFKKGYDQAANFKLTAQSNNANLDNLVVSSGNPLQLSPSFNKDTTSYTIDLDSNAASVLVTPTLEDKGATMTVNGAALASGTAKEIPLSIGQTTVTVVVKAPNGITTKTYTVTIKTPQLSISRSLGKSTVKVGDETAITYTIEPKPLRADQVAGNDSIYEMTNILYREDVPSGVTVTYLDSSWTTTSSNSSSHIDVKLPSIKYQRSGDQYIAPNQTYTVKLKATQDGSYIFDNAQLEYPYVDGTRKTGRFNSLILYAEPVVTSMMIDKQELEMKVGDVYDRLKVTVLPAQADQRVTWSSSQTAIVAVDSGVLTAKAPGIATITVTSADGRVSAQCKVTVTQPVTGVSLDKSRLTMYVGDKEQLTATVKPSNATNQTVKWSTGDSAIATVDENGEVTAKAIGKTTIKVTASGGYTATCEIEVLPALIKVTGVELNQSDATMNVGDTLQLVATVKPENATNDKVTWSTSDEAVATVDENGTIVAKKPGTAMIKVTTVEGNFTATCIVTVLDQFTGFKVYGSAEGGPSLKYEGVTFVKPVFVELEYPDSLAKELWVDGSKLTYPGVRIKIEKEGTTIIGYREKLSDAKLTYKAITINQISTGGKGIITIKQTDAASGKIHLDITINEKDFSYPVSEVMYQIEKADKQFNFSKVVADQKMSKIGSVYSDDSKQSLDSGFYLVSATVIELVPVYDEKGDVVGNEQHPVTLEQKEGFLVSPGYTLNEKIIQIADGTTLTSSSKIVSNKPITVSLIKEKPTDSFFNASVTRPSNDSQKLLFGTLFDKNNDGVITMTGPSDKKDWDWLIDNVQVAIVPNGTNPASAWRPLKSAQIVITAPDVEWEIYLKITDTATRWGSPAVENYKKLNGTFKIITNKKKL